MATLIGQLKWPRSALSLADRLGAFGEAGELDINANYAAMVTEARDAMLLQWLSRWREWHHQQPIVRGARVVGLRRTSRAAGLCLAGVAGVMLALTGCSVAPESRSAQAPLAATLAKARLDPVAATAELNAYRAEKRAESAPARPGPDHDGRAPGAGNGGEWHDVPRRSRLIVGPSRGERNQRSKRGKPRRGLYELRRGLGRLARLGRP